MSHPMIKVEHISKQYKIGVDRKYKTFQDAITTAVKSPLSYIKKSNKEDNTFWALKDVSFDIEEGEVVGIIGRNGAGKSTLLKILSRITEPTEGKITMNGRVASLLEVGTGFHPELTGRENVYLNGSILGMKKREIDAKFDEIVKFAEIEKFLDTPVKRYSSGMYMRLAFAVAAHLEPEILLVDEVLAVGDAQFQKKCLGKMGEVAKGGKTVLFVSHNMSAISNICTHGLLLLDGGLAYSGTAISTVIEYQKSEICNREKMEWVAPQDRLPPFANVLRIKRFYIREENEDIPQGKLLNSKYYDVVIDVDLIQADSRIIFEVAYYSENRHLLFATDIHDAGGIMFDKITPGALELSVPIPVDLLGNKVYEIELLCALHYTGWVLPPNNESTIKFEFFRDRELNPYANDTRLGALSPVLKWKVLKY